MVSQGHVKTISSNIITVALVIVVYVLSPIPFFLGVEHDSKRILTFYQYTLPILAGSVVVLLLFKQSRRVSEEQKNIMEKIRVERRRVAGLGAIAGLISSVSVVVLVLLGEHFTNLPLGTYFSVLGTVIGQNIFGNTHHSILLGLIAHLITGAAIGSVFGGIMAVVEIFDLKRRSHTTILGTMAGFVSFLALFNPISRLGVEPFLKETLSITMSGSNSIVIENTARQMMSNLLAGSILIHLSFGFILGLTLYTLARRYSRTTH
jgi:hypothetical protein